MFRLSLKLKGLFAACRNVSQTSAFITAEGKAAMRDAMREWVTRTGSPSFRDSFGAEAYGKRGFTRRAPAYERRQVAVLGMAQPYASPRGPTDYTRMAKALLSGNAQGILRAIQRTIAAATPMRQLIFQEGPGFNVRASGNRKVTAAMSVPGARVLNRGGKNPKMQRYREELLTFSLRARGPDRAWIYKRAQELMKERMWSVLFATPQNKAA